MHKLEAEDESSGKEIIPVAMVAGVIVGGINGMAVAAAAGLEADGWTLAIMLVTTAVGGGAVLGTVSWALRVDLARLIDWWRMRVAHDDDVIEMMGRDIETDELRHAAEAARLEGEIERLCGELEDVRIERERIERVLAETQRRVNGELGRIRRMMRKSLRNTRWQGYLECASDLQQNGQVIPLHAARRGHNERPQ